MTKESVRGSQRTAARAGGSRVQAGAGKHAAAEAAAGLVIARAEECAPDALLVGLGTGSTAELFLAALAREPERIANIRGVPTSRRTEQVARDLGIRVVDAEGLVTTDIVVDGTDEIDEDLNLMKGGGGALLREKIVASSTEEFVVIAEDHKFVHRLGRFPLPVEVVPFGVGFTAEQIRMVLEVLDLLDTTTSLTLRKSGDRAFVTDNGNFIFDINLGPIEDPGEVETFLNMVPGVVECGIFSGDLPAQAIIGHDNGSVDILLPDREDREDEMAWLRKKRGPRNRLS